VNYKKELLCKTKKIIISVHDWKIEGNMVMGACNERTIEIIETTEIKKLAGFISIFKAPIVKGLGIQGIIQWYDENKKLLVSMSFDVICNKFQFEYNGKLYQKRITKEGAIYFEGLVKSA
jgi:23S rRNA C2498 (ribose-2'-O)-methylase RlmM